jgi:tetratricopeptide (TPR) repeat protein
LQDFSKVVELDQEDADAWYYIGFIYNQTNNYEQAVIALTKVIGMEADAGDAYFERGIAWFNLMKDEDACTDWSEGILIGNEMCKKMYDAECVQ